MTAECRSTVWLFAIYSVRQCFGPGSNILLNLLIKPSKQFTGWLLKNHFIRQCGRKTRFACELLMSRYIGPILRPQEKSHFLLRECQTFAMGS